jgi:hypothetical protein
MLITTLLLLRIGFMQNIMDLLANVMNTFNKIGGFVSFILNMGRFYLCGHKGQCNINGIQRLDSQPHLEGLATTQAMEIYVVVVLNIGENLIPCAWIIGVVHVQYMHDHPIDDLCLANNLGVEGSRFGDLGVQP